MCTYVTLSNHVCQVGDVKIESCMWRHERECIRECSPVCDIIDTPSPHSWFGIVYCRDFIMLMTILLVWSRWRLIEWCIHLGLLSNKRLPPLQILRVLCPVHRKEEIGLKKTIPSSWQKGMSNIIQIDDYLVKILVWPRCIMISGFTTQGTSWVFLWTLR